MLAAGLTILIVLVIFYLSLCKAAGKDNFKDEYRDKWIEQMKREEKEEFKGYFFCDDDCYMCGDLERCKKAVKKEGQV